MDEVDKWIGLVATRSAKCSECHRPWPGEGWVLSENRPRHARREDEE